MTENDNFQTANLLRLLHQIDIIAMTPKDTHWALDNILYLLRENDVRAPRAMFLPETLRDIDALKLSDEERADYDTHLDLMDWSYLDV